MTTSMMTAIGLMSGTSMDGIDVALLRTDGEGQVSRGPFLGLPYEAAFRDRLKEALELARPLTDRTARPGTLAAIERDLTLRHAAAVRRLLSEVGLPPAGIDVVGFHGQTVLHRPDEGLTIQLGDGALLARELGIKVVYDMRANDMAEGGQGAPLVPAYHAALRAALGAETAAFVNIGGISNLTWLGPDGEIRAFDSGPGNTLIDQWVEQEAGIPFDKDGRIARGGTVREDIVARYLDRPFFRGNARRSLDRGDFPPLAAGAASLEDGAATLAYLAGAAIVASLDRLPAFPSVLAICGGGRLNPAIMQTLETLAKQRGATVIPVEAAGLDGDAMEAEAWAYLAVRSLKGLPLTFPTTTGCDRPVSGGVLNAKSSID